MTELRTTIKAVVVYPDRARVTRQGSASLEVGDAYLEILELPLHLDPSSVRASARGTARARLLGVDVRRDFFVETPAHQVRELEQAVESVEDELRGLEAQAALLNRERAVLDELVGQTEAFARGLAFGRTGVDEQMALLDGVRERAGALDGRLLELSVTRRDTQRRLEKLRNELDQRRGQRRRERYTAVVEVDVTQAGDLAVELTYNVQGAGWSPLYDLRLVEGADSPHLEVGYLAQVTQRTGEDWDGVELSLSTARPALAETVPELDPWYIGPVRLDRRKPGGPAMLAAPAPQAMKMSAMTTGAAEPEAEEAAVDELADAAVAMATVEASGAAVTYRVPGQIGVPADGAPHKVTVASFSLAPDLDYVTAPKLVQETYRRAKVVNESAYTLLPGPANLFSGDEFIGTTELQLVAPQGEIELYLGVDDRIKVERELKRREVDKKLIGDRRRIRFAYETTLENVRSDEVAVTLHDHFPVSRHESVKVKLEAVDPKPAEQTELNHLQWDLVLAAGEERVVRFDFSVEHPRDMSLRGVV